MSPSTPLYRRDEKARAQLLAQRRSLAEALAGGCKKGQTENHIERIVKVQAAIDVIVGNQPRAPRLAPASSIRAATRRPMAIARNHRPSFRPSFNSFELARRLPKAQLSITSLRPRASELQRIEQVYHVRLLLVDNPHLVLDRFVLREESTEVVLRR